MVNLTNGKSKNKQKNNFGNSDYFCQASTMKLTLVLLRRNRLPNGHLFRGKDRLVKKVEPVHLRRLDEQFAIEEKNMLYLRHPYLTEEESHGHMKALQKPEMRLQAIIDQKRKIFKQDITLFERLKHLRVSEGWE